MYPIFFALAAVAASAQEPPPGSPSMLRSDTFHFQSAMQQAARRLFATAPGTLLQFTRLHDDQEFHQSAEFEKYEVSTRAGKVGQFTRMRVYPNAESTIDLAVQLENGRITAVEPIRPVTLNGKAFFDLPKALLGLQEAEVGQYAHALSRLFLALNFIEGSSEGASKPPPTPEKAKRLWEKLRQENPGMQPGDPMPPFTATDAAGKAISAESLAGKRTLVLMAMVKRPLSRQVIDWVHKYVKEKGKRFTLVEILADREEALEQYRLRGGTLAGAVILDPDKNLRKLFKGGFMPSVYAFGRDGKLAKLLEPPWTDYRAMASALDGVR